MKMGRRRHCPYGKSTVRNEYSQQPKGDCGTLTRSPADRLISTLNPYVALICTFRSWEQSLDVTSATVIAYFVERYGLVGKRLLSSAASDALWRLYIGESELQARGVCFGRFTSAVENVCMDESNLL